MSLRLAEVWRKYEMLALGLGFGVTIGTFLAILIARESVIQSLILTMIALFGFGIFAGSRAEFHRRHST